MRMQKEEKVVMVLLLMALSSLVVAFWAFAPEDGTADGATALEKETGLSVEGLVLEMKPTKSGGNLLLTLDSTPLPVFVPGGAGAKEIQQRVHPGDRVRVRGTVSEFQGKKELKTARAGDLERIGP